MFRSEVLPAPLGPMIEAIAPRSTATDTSSTARTPPNRFDTAAAFSNTSAGASAGRVVTPTAMLRAFSLGSGGIMRRRYARHDADATTRMQRSRGAAPHGAATRSPRHQPKRLRSAPAGAAPR